MQKVVLVSGGSSGIGLACARLLARRGWRVALVARDPDRLQLAQDLISKECGACADVFAADVTDEAACARVIHDVVRQSGRLDWLITSAGIVEPGYAQDTPAESFRRQMETNYFGSLNLVIPTIEVMRGLGGGRMTLVSSGAAFVGLAGYGGYAPSKFAVRALAEVLRIELSPHNIEVSVACPPDTETPQLDEERKRRPAVTSLMAASGGVMSADKVAEKIIDQAEAGRFLLAPSPSMRALSLFHSLYAPFLIRRQSRLMRRFAGKPPESRE